MHKIAYLFYSCFILNLKTNLRLLKLLLLKIIVQVILFLKNIIFFIIFLNFLRNRNYKETYKIVCLKL